MNKKLSWSLVAAVLWIAGCGGAQEERALGQRTIIPDDWTCAKVTNYLDRNLGNDSFRLAPPVGGSYTIDAAGDVVTLASSDGIIFYWTSTLPIRAILTSAGPGSTVAFTYVPPEPGVLSGAVYAHDSTTRLPATYVDFCFDAPPPQRLQITKTASTSMTATYGWTIDKQGSASALTLAPGQQFDVGYTVTVSPTGPTYSEFAVAGEITIHNPNAVAATIAGVTDAVGAAAVPVDCGVALPYTLGAGGTLVCGYAAALPDGTAGVNTATVTTTGPVAGGTATAAFDFSGATVKQVDALANVTDSRKGALGSVGTEVLWMTFTYPLSVGPYAACGDYVFDNTATFVAVDTQATGSDTWNVAVHVPCAGGCTLTPGYWKTHSKYGPSAYDDTWALVGEDTPFFLSGTTWYGVLWTPSSAGAYYQLARAYVAARLNELNGADVSAVAGDLAAAKALFETYTPAGVTHGQVRAQFISLASKLEAYNVGTSGPGHCSE